MGSDALKRSAFAFNIQHSIIIHEIVYFIGVHYGFAERVFYYSVQPFNPSILQPLTTFRILSTKTVASFTFDSTVQPAICGVSKTLSH